ncbi:LOG family protein ORF6 in fasciation locus [mine drainage metagenome]|uniref:LOG family protein ORF6 in fasciation locus n=1 Tax=mine drainage metagenome TaxID=410659 RepID=A0A1J5QE03_9ZZZZ
MQSVCVYCGSRPGADPRFLKAAQATGQEIARRDLTLVYGGGSLGLMNATADATLSAGGKVVGVITDLLMEREVGHQGLSELHVVQNMHQRKQGMADRADGFIALPGGVFKPYAGVSTAILLFTKVWGPKDKVTQPATEHVWFYEMAADGYSLDDKRSKQDGNGDLQDIVARYHARNPVTDTDRTAKYFMVPRTEIADEKNNYDLSLSRYKTDVFEEVHYDAPGVILDLLIQAEVGDVDEAEIAKVQSGIVRELLELKGMVG